jgi:transcriptional regulator with XRE-family HTH domain
MVDPIDIAVGARLREIRKARGFSQEKLADALGVSFQQVQKYERGTNRISASMMARAAAALLCSAAELMGEGEIAGLSPLTRQMVETFDRLPSDRARLVVLDIAKVLLDEV